MKSVKTCIKAVSHSIWNSGCWDSVMVSVSNSVRGSVHEFVWNPVRYSVRYSVTGYLK